MLHFAQGNGGETLCKFAILALWFAIYPVGVAARVQVTQGFLVLFCPAVSGFCNLMEWQHQFFPVLPHLPAYLWLLLWLSCLVLY